MNSEQDLRERLADELKTIATQADELVQGKGKEMAERTKDIRDRLEVALQTAQQTLDSLETRAEEGIQAADRAVRANPYQAIGIALGLGLVAGMLMKRK